MTGNKVCASAVGRAVNGSGTKKFVDCWTWYKHGKRYLSLWSGEKNGKDGYFDGEMKKLTKGDNVSKRYKKLVASN